MSSQQVLAVKNHWETMAATGGQQLPFDEFRARSDAEWSKLTAEPRGVDYVEVDAGGQPAMWITPKGAAVDRAILALHGGGFIGGSMYTHRKMFGHLAKAAGCRALAIDYRLAPEHKYPAALDDTLAAYRWLLEREKIAPAHLALAGDSAGGGLVMSLLLRARDERLPLPAGAMLLSTWVDFTCSGASYASNVPKDPFFRRELVEGLVATVLGPGDDPKHPYCSPLFGRFAGLPPLYVQVGGDEALLDDSRGLASRARDAGVEVRLDVFPEMLHTFQMAAGRAPEANDAIAHLAAWVRPRLGMGS
jgi:acetyl esterase/lipase